MIFFYRQSPNYIFQSLTFTSHPEVNINNSYLFIRLSIKDFNGNILNLTDYIDIQVYHGMHLNATNPVDIGIISKLNTIDCSEIKNNYMNF